MTAAWGDVATWGAAVGGLVTGGLALWISHGARAETRRQADEMVEANRIAREALRQAQEATRPTVAWVVTHRTGDTYVVTNTGTATAWDVEVQHEGLVAARTEPAADHLAAGEAIEFLAVVHVQTRDNTVYVHWRAEPEGERRTWRHPLPVRPRR